MGAFGRNPAMHPVAEALFRVEKTGETAVSQTKPMRERWPASAGEKRTASETGFYFLECGGSTLALRSRYRKLRQDRRFNRAEVHAGQGLAFIPAMAAALAWPKPKAATVWGIWGQKGVQS
ncbi:hypothetical protein CCR78_11540 [Rhodovulum imhoffii]|nr:hypothetical protein [Rhodovulum imhoffii]MBK5934604.1 hypothetical protein [Rhodovulum imhoffii]